MTTDQKLIQKRLEFKAAEERLEKAESEFNKAQELFKLEGN